MCIYIYIFYFIYIYIFVCVSYVSVLFIYIYILAAKITQGIQDPRLMVESIFRCSIPTTDFSPCCPRFNDAHQCGWELLMTPKVG